MDVNSTEDKIVSETRGQSKYKKGGTAGIEGILFQVNLLTLVLLNAFQNFKGWKLSTENKSYGKFDDVVLELPDGAILLQAKHRKSEKLRFNEMFSVDSKNSDFSLGKYFFSYQEIKAAQVQVKYVVICTNSEVEVDNETREKFFNTEKDTSDSILYHSDGYSFYTFNDSILPKLEEHVRSYYIKNLKEKNAGKGEEIITLENLSDFINHLKFYCSYPSEQRLNMIIEQFFSNIKFACDLSCETSAKYIHTKMLDWFRQPHGIHLEDCHVKAMIAEMRSNRYCKELDEYNVFFDNTNLVFVDTKRILHVISKDLHLLNVLKIYRTLQSNNKTRIDILYVSSDDSAYIQHIVEAFELPQYTHLIIIWPEIKNDHEIMKINLKLREILHKKPYKKVILVSEDYNRLASEISVNNDLYETTEECISFKNLSTDTQSRLLKEKNIDFQGKYISLKKLFSIQTLKTCEEVLDSETMEKLIKPEKIKVGSPVDSLDEHTKWYYVRRKFIRKINNSGYNKDKKEFIDEENLCDLEDKLILIADSAGAGKTTVVAHLAVTIKEAMPHLWVLRINLNDYTKALKEAQTKNTESVIDLLEFLNMVKLSNQFERNVFSMEQRVLLMLDGVDEISPNYTKLVLRLISQCQEASNFYKILITSRPHMVLELEAKLNVKAFTLQFLTEENQIHFLTNYWMHSFQGEEEKRKKCEHYAQAVINNMASWMRYNNDDQNSLTAIPLQLRMLAEIFETTDQMQKPVVWNGCKQYLDADEGEPVLPGEMNVAQLYKMFIIKKRDSFKHKGNPDDYITADEALDKKFEESLDYHRSLALEKILNFTDYRYFSCHQNINRSNTDMHSILKIGIIQQIGNGLHFMHRTFAEYFVAESILLELEKQQGNPNRRFQKSFIDDILRLDVFNLKVVRSFLDSFLQNTTNSLTYDIFRNKRFFNYKINLKEPYYNPKLIHWLAEEGFAEILRFLFKCIGFKAITNNSIKMLNYKDTKFPLMQRKRFSVETLNYFKYVTDRCGVNFKDDMDSTPLHYAINNNHLGTVKVLIEHGANIDNTTTLWSAILCENIDIVKYLMNVVDINAENISVQSTAVDKVCTRYKLLVENELHGNIDQVSRYNDLQTVVTNYRLDCVKFLVRNGADVNNRFHGQTSLHIAVRSNQFEIVKFLIMNGANVNASRFDNGTPLHLAVSGNQFEIVKFLIMNEANVNASSIDNTTPLHLAVQGNQFEMVKFLIINGANVNAGRFNNETPLHLAVRGNQYEIVKFLVENEANVNHKMRFNDETPLHLAVQGNQFEIVKFLVENGANVNVRSRRGKTPLQLAVQNNQFEIVKFLIENGADANSVDNKGCPALDIACVYEHDAIKSSSC